MSAYDRFNVDALLEEIQNPPVTTDLAQPPREGFGATAFEAMGQSLWGFTTGFSWGLPEIADIADEAVTGRPNRIEEWVTSIPAKAFTFGDDKESYAGDFSSSATDRELTLPGKIGYTVGNAVGMLASFGWLGKGLSAGIRGVSKLGSGGMTTATKLAQDEITESFGKIVFKAGQKEGAEQFTEEVSKDIATNALNIVSKSGVHYQANKKLGDAMIQQGFKQSIKEEALRPILGNIDDALLDKFAGETLEIAMRRSPNEGMNIINNGVLNLMRRGGTIQDLSRAQRISASVAGASVYDALLGTVIGAVRGLGEYKINESYNWNKPESALGHILDTAAHEAAIFSILGPVKFIRGGGRLSAIKKTKDMTRGVINSLRPVKKMTAEQLETNIELMHHLSGGNISSHLGGKWIGKADGWWKGAGKLSKKEAEKSVKEMREFLTESRRVFLKEAPGVFASEVGADMFYSLPRMMTGAVAMNLTGLKQAIDEYGVTGFMEGFGATDYEKVSNIMTAMFFTKTPHSFHLPGAAYPAFETGNIRNFSSRKGEQFSKVVTGLNLIGGRNYKSALQIASQYGGMSDTTPADHFNKVYSKSFEGAEEIQRIREVIDPHTSEKYVTPQGEEPIGGLRVAGAKYIAENVTEIGEKADWRNKLSTALKIVRWHDENSAKTMDISAGLTKEAAGDLINKLSSIEFDGKRLSPREPQQQLNDWLAARISRESNVPISIIKDFVVESYRELGVPNVGEIDGVIVVPRINENLFGSYVDKNTNKRDGSRPESGEALRSLVTATQQLEKLGVVRFAEAVHDASSDEMISKSIDVKNTAVKKMMQYVHGDAWETKALDDSILRNPSWYVQHNKLSDISQKLNVERVLKGSGDHGLDENSANKLYEDLRDNLSGNSFPEITTKDNLVMDDVQISQTADLAGAIKDMRRVHNLVNLVNPQSISGPQRNLSAERLLEIHGQWSRTLGDAVTNDVLYSKMQEYLVGKAIKNLGISRLSGGYNLHAGIHQLVTNKEFMRSTGMQIPKVEQVKAMLEAKGDQITPETRDSVLKYYNSVVGAITESRLGKIQVREMVEQQQGAWYEAIRSSMLTGRGRASEFAYERILDFTNQAQDLLDQHQVFADEMTLSASREGINTIKEKKLTGLFMAAEGDIRKAVAQYKSAIESGDGFIVHAYADRMDRSMELLDLITQSAVTGTHGQYTQELLKLSREAISEAERSGWTELTVKEEASRIMGRHTIPEKDTINTGIRVSSSQFAQKYDLNITDMTNMFLSYRSMNTTMGKTAESILNVLDKVDPMMEYNGVRIFTPQQASDISKTREYVKNVIAKSGSPDPNKFWQEIVDPLMFSIRTNEIVRNRSKINKEPEGGWDKYNQTLISDISSITTAYFSSMPVKQYSYRNGQLFLGEAKVGYTDKHGVQGVISALNGTSEISMLSNGFYIGGKYVSKPNKKQMQEIIREIESGDGLHVEMDNGLREYLGDRKKIEDHKAAEGNDAIILNKQRFKVISADESTLMLVRIGRDGRIENDLLSGFRKSGKNADGQRMSGGHLYEKIQASLEYDPITKSVDYPTEISRIVDRINEGKLTDNEIHDAVVLTRIINDRPSLIRKFAELSAEERKKSWKYLKLSEMKGGFVGHEENLARVRSFLEGAASQDKSGFFANVLEQARIFLPKDKNAKFPKMKLLSVADEMVHQDGKLNIFSSIDHKIAELTDLKSREIIDEATFNENVTKYKALSKSIVDGETFISKRAYVANLAMMGGISPDMVKFGPGGEIQEIMIGGIKPTISHTDVKTDMSDLTSYGRVKEFYAKTAFKYNPEFDQLFTDLKIDGITFNSANKINEYRNKISDPWYNTDMEQMQSTIAAGNRNVHASIKPIESHVDMPKGFGSVSQWLGKIGNIIHHSTNIHEIPFESINLKSLGQPHDPLVGSNLSVHMHDNVGIREWIGLDAKIKNTYSAFEKYVDPYYATRLARDLFAHSSDTGDMTWLNTGIDHFLKHDGLLISPWAKTKIEEKIIPYFMNNGMIAAGRVPEGSLDVMTADTGGLRTSTVRTEADGGRSVQLYGEFVQSKHAAEKEFKIGGVGKREDVQSVIIQTVKHGSFDREGNYELRSSDAFLVRRGKEKYVIIEGKAIDKEGSLRDIYDDSIISYKGNNSTDNKRAKVENRKVFNEVVARENEFLNDYVQKGMNYSEVMTQLYWHGQDPAYKEYDMALGSLNNRQPRNQAGDVVVSRLKAHEIDGKVITHNGEFAGNSSRMNHADAINPQDADYDMDKSSSFLAAPSRLWAEAGRLAGYRTVDDIKGIEAIFDKFSAENPKLFTWEGDPHQYKGEINATDLARGRFVKMHQTLTYMQNILRDNRGMMIRMANPFGGYNPVEIRMNTNKLRYLNTVDEVSKNVKLFLDMYKENPFGYTVNPEPLIRELIFGFERSGVKHEGLFDLYNAKTGERIVDQNINDSSTPMKRARDDIYYGLISPVGRYLKYNKGTTTDETNRDLSATLQDYQNARRGLMFSILPNKKGLNFKTEYKGKDVLYDNTGMYEAANNYFANSANPFDVAMKGLHEIANKHHGLDETKPGTHHILNYLKDGRMPAEWSLPPNIKSDLTTEFQMNRIAKEAMHQLAQKTGDIVKFEELAANLRRINSKIEYLDGIGGNRGRDIKETTEYRELQGQKIRTEELKSIVEEHLSYDSNNPKNEYVYNPAQKEPKKQGDYTNFENRPLVVVNKKGETKEVILPGRRNIKDIYSSDRLVKNGHRYEIVDGEAQMGLRSDFRAFGGQVKYVHEDGRITHISKGEQVYINSEYNNLRQRINEMYAKLPDRTGPVLAEYAARRTSEILDLLSSPEFSGDPARQFAMIARMLRPNWDPNVSPIIPTRFGQHSRTSVVGSIKFTENKLAQGVWNTLAQVANGSVEVSKGGIDKTMANRLLKDLISLSRSYYVQEKTGIEVDMRKLEKIGFTEPTELPHGYMTDAQYLNKGIYKIMRDGDKQQRHAAGLMYDYMSGSKMVDSATLYKASKAMEEAGIRVDEQFMMKTYDRETNTYGDVEVRNFGVMDAYNSRNRGQGGIVKESTTGRVKELFKCLDLTK
jgi:hypothetical protein